MISLQIDVLVTNPWKLDASLYNYPLIVVRKYRVERERECFERIVICVNLGSGEAQVQH